MADLFNWYTLSRKSGLIFSKRMRVVKAMERAMLAEEAAIANSEAEFPDPHPADAMYAASHQLAEAERAPEPEGTREPDWLLIATMLCLHIDMEHKGEPVLPSDLAANMKSIHSQSESPSSASEQENKNG